MCDIFLSWENTIDTDQNGWFAGRDSLTIGILEENCVVLSMNGAGVCNLVDRRTP